ncbi:hypothetical protein LOCC1_G007801 [Lachnellula occidentalis]|uniref:Zn(2)-C6 fungal-type domain-containing protein n=1 Tax=Lachnellula occidentalis TaxID=215460 RepID=A0A8H8U7A2_9HELO|nr:hypothetical protein LOCC1_G007801 [Lachnellula occidentalis]
MSYAYAPPPKPSRIPEGDQEHVPAPPAHERGQWMSDQAAQDFTTQAPPYMTNYYHHGPDNFIQENWLPETNQSWSAEAENSSQSQWSHDATPPLLASSEGSLGQERPFLYSDAEQSALGYNTGFDIYEPGDVSGLDQIMASHPRSRVHPINQVAPYYHFRTPQETQFVPPIDQHLPFESASTGPVDQYMPPGTFDTSLPLDPSWLSSYPEPLSYSTATGSSPVLSVPGSLPPKVELDWSSNEQLPNLPSDSPDTSFPLPKRKRESPQPTAKTAKKGKPKDPQQGLAEFVVVFENAPGALANIKHRRKLDAPVRKAARDVRKAGACHQCRFRKRTCSTGTPCTSCLKNGNGLHEVKCQRESPFVGKVVYEYFRHSSTRRIVTFNVTVPIGTTSAEYLDSDWTTVVIDGVGGLSHPIKLKAQKTRLSLFSAEEQKTITQTEDQNQNKTKKADAESVIILADGDALGQQVEQWAVEYTSKFIHAAGPKFYATTMAQILGTAYVKKGLPESKLVGAMVRVASIAFVLRAGVKCSEPDLSSRFRTIQAKIDTVLYERLILAVNELFQKLQHLIFRTAGSLNRESIYPVALVLWQLLRILCISSSHLSNIAQKFQSKANGQADYQFVNLRLVLSTHMALFRSSSPLLLDLSEKSNQDLLGNDADLIKLAGEMRKVVLTFRDKGFPDLKGSIAYKKEYFDMFRKVYDGM